MEISDLMKQAQDLRKKMSEFEKTLGNERIIGEAGGGMVQVIADGNPKILEVKISEQGKQEEAEVIGELIAAATNDVLKKANALRTKKQAEMLGMPGGIQFPFSQ